MPPFFASAAAPDVDAVLLHGGDQHGAGHGAAWCVEVGDAGSGEGTSSARLLNLAH
jgi:hypothetical protein